MACFHFPSGCACQRQHTCFREFGDRQIGGRIQIEPAHLLYLGLWGNFDIQLGDEGMGHDLRPCLIGGLLPKDALISRGIFRKREADFLGKFTVKRLLRRFTRIDLAARLHELRGAALAHDKHLPPRIQENGGSDDDFAFRIGAQGHTPDAGIPLRSTLRGATSSFHVDSALLTAG